MRIISGIILAAGSSKRMGKQKLLLPFKESTILETVIDICVSCGLFREIILVYQSSEVLDKIKDCNLKAVYNPIAEQGQSTSVIAGIKNCLSNTKAYMFIMGDQPLINIKIIGEIIETWKQNPESIIVPRYNKKNGMPTIFPSYFKQDLLNIKGDKGGRDIIKANPNKTVYIDIQEVTAGFDIDTKEDYEKILKQSRY